MFIKQLNSRGSRKRKANADLSAAKAAKAAADADDDEEEEGEDGEDGEEEFEGIIDFGKKR